MDALLTMGARDVTVGPLGDDGVAALVGRVAPNPSDRLLGWTRRAGGNPFYVIELAKYRGEAGAAELPGGVRRVLLRRLDEVGSGTAEMLRAASVLGTRFGVEELASMLERSPVELLGHLAEARQAGLLVDQAGGLAFRHDLVREAIYGDLGDEARAALHRRAGAALRACGASRLEVAKHLSVGAITGDRAAVAALVDAAHEAAATAPGTAVELLERAVGIAGPESPGRDRLFGELALLRLWAGRIAASEELARRVLSQDHDPMAGTSLRLALVSSLVAQARPADALSVLPGSLDLHSERGVELAATAAWVLMLSARMGEARRVATEAHAAARRQGFGYAACVALGALATIAYATGDLQEALAFGAEGVAEAERGQTAKRFHAHLFHGVALAESDRFEEARRVLEAGRRRSEQLGMAWSLAYFHAQLARVHYFEGSWDDALADAHAGLALCEETGTADSVSVLTAVVALISLWRDDLAEAQRAIGTGEQAPVFSQHSSWIPWTRSLLEERAGTGSAQTLERLWATWTSCLEAGTTWDLPHIAPDLVRMSLLSGHTDRAQGAVEQVEEAAARMGASWALAAAQLCRGLVQPDEGHALRAVDCAERSGRPLLLAQCAEAAAAVAAERDAAVSLLRRAASLYGRLEAQRDAARVRASLRRLGVRAGVMGTRPARPRTGWESLTAKERAVVGLVAEGLTNAGVAERLYLSPRTVESHLSRVFSKLGVSGRGELIARAARAESIRRP